MPLPKLFSFKIKNQDIEETVKYGYQAAILIMIISSLAILYSVFISSILDLTVYAFLDVFLIGFMAFGIYKKNRFASLCLIIYWAIDTIYLLFSGYFASIFLKSFFLFIFIKTSLAIFKYRENLQIKKSKKYKNKGS